jgi:transposase
MRKSRLSQARQDRLIEHFVAGTTPWVVATLVGVNKNTAAYYYLRLRALIWTAT